MKALIDQDPAVYQEIQQRAQTACIRFRGREMPENCTPSQADVGFEVQADGCAILYVQYGVDYGGSSTEVREWFEQGKKEFASFELLVLWLQGPLREEFQERPDQSSQTTAPAAHYRGSDSTQSLTDLRDLQQRVQQNRRSAPQFSIDHVYQKLSERIRGQDTAIRTLASTAVRHTRRVKPRKPSVMFSVGPSGVGKTESAQVLARIMSEIAEEGQEYGFLRLDMTEYQESSRVSQLLGAPQGYIGHDEGSQLLDALDAQPKIIILFDEIEKAHPSILRVLMNAMDEGRLSRPSKGANGHEVDCKKAIFIFTSNLDAQEILNELKKRDGMSDPEIQDEVCRKRLHSAGIAPEIIGRISRFLVFEPLSSDIRAEILAISIRDLAREYGVELEYVEPDVVIHLMDNSANTAFGVRPAQHRLDGQLGDLFAETAANGHDHSYRLSGPPFQCDPTTPHQTPSRTPDHPSQLTEQEQEQIWSEIDQIASSSETITR